MQILGIKGYGILKYLEGTNENGILLRHLGPLYLEMPEIDAEDNYMLTSTGKVVNFLLPEIEVTAKSPTGNAWKDRNLYKAYKGRRYISEGRLEAKPLALGLAGLAALPGITALTPAVSATLNNPYVNAALTVDGVRNAFSDNGLLKTYRLAKEGNYWGATKSGVGDALDLWGGYNMFKKGYSLYTKGPKYIFDNLPYKTINNVLRTISNLKDYTITFFKTPINENPIKAVRNKYKKLLVGRKPRTDIDDGNVYYNTNKTSLLNVNDPIPLIRERLRTRMNSNNYLYAYPHDGIAIYLDNRMYDPDYIISRIPVKEYLSLKDVYKMGVDKHSGLMDKVTSVISTPISYLRLNMEPAFAHTGNKRFVKVNKKAIKDFGSDYPTVLSHEYNHALRTRNVDDVKGKLVQKLGFNYDHLEPRYNNYLSDPTEIEARGTLLKNYFNSDVITPDMLKYAAQHYVPDTNMDNNMYLFFSGIKDWDLAAEYLTKFSLKNGGKLK